MAKNSFHCQWIATSITNSLPVYHCQMLMRLLLLRLVSEACQMSTSVQVAIGWLVQATTLLENTTRLVDDIGHGFSYVL